MTLWPFATTTKKKP